MRLIAAGMIVIVSASIAVSSWVVILPPMTRKPHCEVLYDKSAPIAKWKRQHWGPFETLEACEQLRTEMVKRTTAPGRRERLLAIGQEREKEALESQRQLRRQFKGDPEARQLAKMVPRYRKGDVALCDVVIEDWTDSRCVEESAP